MAECVICGEPIEEGEMAESVAGPVHKDCSLVDRDGEA